MRRNFALWAGCAVLVAVVVAGVTVATFPRESSHVRFSPIPVPSRTLERSPVSLGVKQRAFPRQSTAKPLRRAPSIGAYSGRNGDAGLAGSSPAVGAQSGTPGP